MKKISKIILFNKDKVLLQLRDNNPNIAHPNTWTLFGGNIQNNESPESALKRELFEELGITLDHFKKLFTKNRNQDGSSVEDHIFAAKIDKSILKNNLSEGQKMKFFSLSEIDKINVFLPFKKYISEFFISQN